MGFFRFLIQSERAQMAYFSWKTNKFQVYRSRNTSDSIPIFSKKEGKEMETFHKCAINDFAWRSGA